MTSIVKILKTTPLENILALQATDIVVIDEEAGPHQTAIMPVVEAVWIINATPETISALPPTIRRFIFSEQHHDFIENAMNKERASQLEMRVQHMQKEIADLKVLLETSIQEKNKKGEMVDLLHNFMRTKVGSATPSPELTNPKPQPMRQSDSISLTSSNAGSPVIKPRNDMHSAVLNRSFDKSNKILLEPLAPFEPASPPPAMKKVKATTFFGSPTPPLPPISPFSLPPRKESL